MSDLTFLSKTDFLLRYSDGDLTLIYPNGDACSSGFQRMTVINFECNETAGEFTSCNSSAQGLTAVLASRVYAQMNTCFELPQEISIITLSSNFDGWQDVLGSSTASLNLH